MNNPLFLLLLFAVVIKLTSLPVNVSESKGPARILVERAGYDSTLPSGTAIVSKYKKFIMLVL